MEQLPWEKVASSKPFRFTVGPAKREFTIHSAVVERQSTALGALVNNANFREARDGHAELESVDEGTFVRFIQYAYTGVYEAPDESAIISSKEDSAGSIEDPWGLRPLSAKKKKGKSGLSPEKPALAPQQALWAKFKSLADQGGQFNSATTSNMRSGNLGADTFLRHARLYVFADCYGISKLMQLAFYNLGQALLAFQLDSKKVEDIVALLKFCYDSSNPVPEDLKSLVVLFTACYVEILWKEKTFQALLEMHGELSTALLGLVVERLG